MIQFPTTQPLMKTQKKNQTIDDMDDIEQTGVYDHTTERIGVDDHNPNNNTEPEHEPWRSNRIKIRNQRVEQIDHIEFEYINLQDTFGDPEPCPLEETIVQIETPNERQNYYNTMKFIANGARQDRMIDYYILK